jgi:hypothetical protein
LGNTYIAPNSLTSVKHAVFARLTWLTTRSMFDVALFYSYMARYHDYNWHGNVTQQLIYYKSN